MNDSPEYFLSASLICADLQNIKKVIKELEIATIDRIHFDVMDGWYVPRFGLLPELLEQISPHTNIPIDVHLMISNPINYIEQFVNAGAKGIMVHLEHFNSVRTLLTKMKTSNIRIGIVLNQTDNAQEICRYIDEIDRIIVMGIKPGITGQSLIPHTYDQLSHVKHLIASNPKIGIEVDGGVTPQTAPILITHGASGLVCGSGTIFQPPQTISDKVAQLRNTISKKINSYEPS